jgi:predicted metal-dependent HD superfamily phosphohydrolase
MSVNVSHATLTSLQSRWRQSCAAAHLRGDTQAVWQQLVDLYTQPWRAYHNLTHIQDCFDILAKHGPPPTDAVALDHAIWFHDAIYEVGASDNEARSASLAAESLASLNAAPNLIERVAHLIRATNHRQPTNDPAAQWLCDIDLSILGRDAATYDAYAAAIQREVSLSDEAFGPPRSTFLKNILTRQRLYQADTFHHTYEAQARTNLQRELMRWNQLRTE